MVKAKIKFILPLVVWLCSLFPNLIIGQRLKLSSQLSKHKEIFFRNLEEGVFGCQLNESQNFLQIFNLSQLCDGVPDCYAQSDENQELVECTDDCFDLKTGKRGCQNGICIKGQCHCNNGFSGCNCDIEDENECLNRPCDVFAHCTNLVGSYKCTCFPGYEGDGSHCKDIDECLDPEINSRCKANSKCCNIPGHYLCKCNEGFRGNGEEHCEDIDECKERINICGKYATCTNTFGNYSCDCDNGYRINALKQCERINDECGEAGICGYGAICKDTKRGKKCECKPGYKLDSNNNCIDTTNECDSSLCSRNEVCINTDTGSKCSCLPGFVRNIFLNECQDINECIDNPCGENTECINILGSYKCICEEGYQQLSNKKDSCIRRDVNILCNSNNECTTNALCKDNQCVCDNGFVAKGSECIDIDECQSKYQICGQNATCLNIVGSYHCHCIDGYIGSPPDTACMKPCDSIQCGPHSYCNATSATEVYCICDDGWTFNPSRISDGCIDIDECIESKHKCSSGAICINTLGSYICRCRDGFEGNPYKGSCVSKHKQCFTDSSCASNEQCILDENGGKCECLAPFYRDGNQCLNPCQRYQCGMHASCSIGDPVNCACDPGFTGNPYTGCVDIDECKNQPCAYGADCINLKGRFECICPKGTLGDPYNNECVIQTTGKYKTECYTHEDCSSYQICKDNSCINSCNLLKCDKNSHCETDNHNAYCKCLDGYKVGPKGTCVSVCDDFKCASGATCIAAEYGPTCQCQDGLRGNPFAGGNCVRDKCSVNNPCPIPLICTDGRCKESCNDLMCGIGASCNQTINQCVCYNNFIGDPMHLCMPPAYPPICDGNCEGNSYCEYGPTGARCKTLSLECPNGCSHGETCVSGHCENKCHNIICGVNAICQLDDNNNPRCYCPPEYSRGNPLVKCSSGKSDEDIETDCRNSGCGRNAQCINMGTFYECQCNADTYGNPNVECNAANEVSCKVNEDCLVEEACINSHCIDSCKIRDTCGKNAICTTKQHRPHCSCPQCYFGMPNIECIFDSKCSSLIPRNQCVQKKCEGNQKCLVKNNQEVCVCAFGYFVNKQGELVCSSKKIQCQNSFDCPLNKACIDGQCENPCQNFECPINKTCHVFNRTPICKCNEDCIASVSICRTDRGCPSHLACRNYRCVNPCTIHNCSNDRDQFCFVRNHQAVCDQCDSGFIKDSQFGCLRANGSKSYCKSIEDCNVQSEICIKNQCIKVCTLQCGSNAQCISKPYQSPKCECFKGFYKKHNSDTCVPMEIKCLKNSDCSTHLECFNGHCENPCSTRNICANNEKCQVYDHEIICIKDVEKKEQVKDCGYCEYGYECDERTGQCVKDLSTSLSPSINIVKNNTATEVSLSQNSFNNVSSKFYPEIISSTSVPLGITSRKMKSDLDESNESIENQYSNIETNSEIIPISKLYEAYTTNEPENYSNTEKIFDKTTTLQDETELITSEIKNKLENNSLIRNYLTSDIPLTTTVNENKSGITEKIINPTTIISNIEYFLPLNVKSNNYSSNGLIMNSNITVETLDSSQTDVLSTELYIPDLFAKNNSKKIEIDQDLTSTVSENVNEVTQSTLMEVNIPSTQKDLYSINNFEKSSNYVEFETNSFSVTEEGITNKYTSQETVSDSSSEALSTVTNINNQSTDEYSTINESITELSYKKETTVIYPFTTDINSINSTNAVNHEKEFPMSTTQDIFKYSENVSEQDLISTTIIKETERSSKDLNDSINFEKSFTDFSSIVESKTTVISTNNVNNLEFRTESFSIIEDSTTDKYTSQDTGSDFFSGAHSTVTNINNELITELPSTTSKYISQETVSDISTLSHSTNINIIDQYRTTNNINESITELPYREYYNNKTTVIYPLTTDINSISSTNAVNHEKEFPISTIQDIFRYPENVSEQDLSSTTIIEETEGFSKDLNGSVNFEKSFTDFSSIVESKTTTIGTNNVTNLEFRTESSSIIEDSTTNKHTFQETVSDFSSGARSTITNINDQSTDEYNTITELPSTTSKYISQETVSDISTLSHSTNINIIDQYSTTNNINESITELPYREYYNNKTTVIYPLTTDINAISNTSTMYTSTVNHEKEIPMSTTQDIFKYPESVSDQDLTSMTTLTEETEGFNKDLEHKTTNFEKSFKDLSSIVESKTTTIITNNINNLEVKIESFPITEDSTTDKYTSQETLSNFSSEALSTVTNINEYSTISESITELPYREYNNDTTVLYPLTTETVNDINVITTTNTIYKSTIDEEKDFLVSTTQDIFKYPDLSSTTTIIEKTGDFSKDLNDSINFEYKTTNFEKLFTVESTTEAEYTKELNKSISTETTTSILMTITTENEFSNSYSTNDLPYSENQTTLDEVEKTTSNTNSEFNLETKIQSTQINNVSDEIESMNSESKFSDNTDLETSSIIESKTTILQYDQENSENYTINSLDDSYLTTSTSRADFQKTETTENYQDISKNENFFQETTSRSYSTQDYQTTIENATLIIETTQNNFGNDLNTETTLNSLTDIPLIKSMDNNITKKDFVNELISTEVPNLVTEQIELTSSTDKIFEPETSTTIDEYKKTTKAKISENIQINTTNKILIKDVKKIDNDFFDIPNNISSLYPIIVNKSMILLSPVNRPDLKTNLMNINEMTNKTCYDDSDCLNTEKCLVVRICNINCTTTYDNNCLNTCTENHSTPNICVNIQGVICDNDNDCADTETCYLSNCKNPCELDNVCGENAQCQSKAHRPMCTCFEGYKGNPSVQCVRIGPSTCTINSDCNDNENSCINGLCQNPCVVNNPCSLYADCFVAGNGSRCVCKNGYEGDGYNCLKINKEAVCHYNIDCLPTEYCDRLNRICVNPCNEEECGQNAECIAEDHKSSCKCLSGYSGDPYQSCSEENFIETSKSPYDQSPCGTNALYSTRNGAGSCVCPNGYIGDPYVKCQPECGIDNDCHLTKACVNGKCKNPCIGQCGINAQCLVRDHKFHCFCDAGYEGNPFEVCQPMRPIEEKKENYNPCLPSPCGPNSACKVIKDRAVCSCLPNFLGTAPNCRHECTNDLNCPSNKACINYKCANPCLNACGVNALCHVNDHKPVCSCSNGFIGDPFVNCILEEKDPCLSSPCGPNAECKTVNGRPACSCLKNYKGRPPNCYPECITNDDCPFNMACENNNCFNPCSREPCGLNAECSIIQHKRSCLCYNGFDGDAEVECTEKKFITEIAKTPCDPSPCGINALCRERNSIGSCSCIENYFGNPYVKCKPECVIDTECLKSKACFQNKCVDPCSGACGNGALCQTIDHRPLCSCPEGTSGDPLSFCKNILQEKKVLNKIDPCMPSPCGPNSQCRSYGDQAVCSCLPKYIGSPPKCHPECSKNSDCDLMKACVNYKCMDPCPGTCGLNAECRVITHSPICSCKPGFNGDPFTKCFPIIVEKDHETNRKNKNPCLLNPCGANSKCTEKDGFPICSCLKGYLGRPPDCRPECTVHSDCRQNQACIKQKCQDPCVAVCGINAECSVVNHVPVCKCIDGFKGDSFVSCQKVIEPEKPIAKDKCNPSPCGNNADCKDGICTCILDYKGDPYRECRPECIVNSDCDQNKACIKNKCKDPCDDTCGLNAFCETFNHIPMCSCINGYSGDPFFKCDKTAVLKQSSPCSPSPCGPNSQCREQDDRAICSCLSEYNGAPPNCRPECVHNSECSLDKSCVNLKCIDTCLGACGFNAQCRMVNHNPICSCPTSFTGDPFVQCQKLAEHRVVIEKINPCIPSPCGPNSICEAIGEKAACACKENYKGSPPNCKPECVSNNDCSSSMGCINFKCMNPCSDLCGLNTTCFVRNHNPNCICLEGYEGDPFVECSPKFQEIATELLNPCEPNPCGENALCRVQNNAGSCTCMESYLGNPYVRCKPECVVNSDCPLNKDCINNKCKDPCPGTCAINAMCQTVNHIPFCTCHDSYTGDAFKYCYPIVESSDRKNIDPCSPSPCGPYSQCKNANEQAVCSCLPEYLGSPPYCRPECTSNSECALEKSCINRKCVDPCSGTCGQNADCRVIDHSPVCSCRPKYSGDPFVKCWPIKIDIISKEISHPCIPNPCGPNSKCLERNQHASCTCLDGYKGVAPYCRSECTINSDCPKDLACMNLKCRDPCPGACGINAKCSVVNHVANCECLAGYEGNSFLSCKKKIERNQEKQDKCNPNPCGENAKCSDGVCTCILDYRGNPYERCRPECLVNLDCANNKACIQTKCQNPCEEACGQNADCNVINHIAVCSCRDGYDGNPFKNCKLMSKTIDNIQPCHPSPCGPNSQCREANGLAVCSCLPNYIGNPPACRPECIYSSDCNLEKTCRNYKCIDPCPGTCGVEAECRAINHNPICTCPSGLIGDPFVRCQRIRQEIENLSRPKDPCNPSPCGLNSKCQVIDGRSVCSCLANFIGSPPYCKRECVSHDECSNHMACINYKCSDPCKDSCGIQAECYVRNHVANCVCSPKYTGDPNIRCTIIVEHEKTIERRDPCEPSPCGINAKCLIENQGYSCQCIDEYQGDPYLICRPECTSNSDCSYDKACVNMKCADPCKETCGKNAQCTVTNHIPNCYCPEDTSGNAFIQCTPISKLEKQNPCIPSPCGLNAECHIRGEFAVCECLAGFFIGDDGVNCKTECTVSSDCPTHKSCSNQQCVDPCDGVCGFGAICNVVNHNPICRCPENTRGDPFKSCIRDIDTPKDSCSSSPCGNNGICNEHNGLVRCTYPECVTNSDCPQTKVCSNLKCHDPCARACGVNALCQVTNHKAYCYCPDNYVGSPKMQCFPKSNIEITQVECNSDSDCGNDKTCINTKCVNPCDEYKYSCGENAKCYAQMHRALCICPDGYSGNAQVACIKVECESSYDCPSNKFCRNNNCVDPCKYVECGQNAQCKVNRNRQAECYCPNSYIGNPLDYCKLPECSVNSDCSKNLACKNNKCVNPCECGINAECFVQNHIAVCTCLSGYSGIPEIACDVRQKTNAKGCRSDSECASKLACINNECQNPCIKNSPCGLNAKCVVVDSLPSRTMSCICEPGLIGDAYVKCNLGHYHAVCNSDFDCSDNEVCLNRECKDVCSLQICAFNADCHGKNHKAFCKCRPGFLGDSLRFCSPTTKLPIPICLRDSDCPSNKICINKDCKDLCKMGSYCGKNTQCEIKDHRPICKCLNGFTGNPSEACYKVECNSDDNCPYDKKCRNNKCVNPCENLKEKCGRNAKCTVTNHVEQCVCPQGTQGNPYLSCVAVECTFSEDCAEDEYCERQNGICKKVCDVDTCTESAECFGKNHLAICECSSGMMIDSYGECKHVEQNECSSDSECGKNLVCTHHKCINPCLLDYICTGNQQCVVTETYPLKTTICKCPDDTVYENGLCKKIPRIDVECTENNQCKDSHKCINNFCIDACKADLCGINSICKASNHQANCYCDRNYDGDPHIECLFNGYELPRPKECSNNKDCPYDKLCLNKICVNPCSLDDQCANNALCRVEHHEVHCSCPPGFKGDPKIQCNVDKTAIKVVECTSHTKCPKDKACIDNVCVNPCNCEPNSICKVINHYPICYCKEGYINNPIIGCVKAECRAKDDCADDELCHNNKCVSVCLLAYPCKYPYSMCYGRNHEAKCKCQEGYDESTNGACIRRECASDNDCTNDKTCRNHKCINPCIDLDENRCAFNAHCHVQYHKALCYCPPHLPVGNPQENCFAKELIENKPECQSDSDCPSKLACIRDQCIQPCEELSPCQSSTKCDVMDTMPIRTLVCTCPDGWISKEDGECTEISLKVIGECVTDENCDQNSACINRICRNPCNCGSNAECYVKNHRAICSCKNGYIGHPQIGCSKVECTKNFDCDQNKACIQNNCIDPCMIKNPCGHNAECYVDRNHETQCRCFRNYYGDPYDKCISKECQSSNECSDDKKCINYHCIDPCVHENQCSSRAKCIVRNHNALCQCPLGYSGDPLIECRFELQSECKIDEDCPSRLACLNGKCQDICAVNEPCSGVAHCSVLDTLPVRTAICVCPDGYVSDGKGSCKITEIIKLLGDCSTDSDCLPDKACMNNICRNPCNCGTNAHCTVHNHRPICSCLENYDGNPEIHCHKGYCSSDNDCTRDHFCQNYKCFPVCSSDKQICGNNAECYSHDHKAVCKCRPGFYGDAKSLCLPKECTYDSDCPSTKSCYNQKCVDSCTLQDEYCPSSTICKVSNHKAICVCAEGLIENEYGQCSTVKIECRSDSDCPSQKTCINSLCINPCNETSPCGDNSKCKVLDTNLVKTIICECISGYEGNALEHCKPEPLCDYSRGLIVDDFGNCICPPGKAFNKINQCVYCFTEVGYEINENNHCVCALEKGFISIEDKECVCPYELNYRIDEKGNCSRVIEIECESNQNCPETKQCVNNVCINPCEYKQCVENAICRVRNHEPNCDCIPGFKGNGEDFCKQIPPSRTSSPPEVVVNCLSDGIQVKIHIVEDEDFNSIFYVKKYSSDERCRKLIDIKSPITNRTEIFKVKFGTCGLVHVNGEAHFILVMQKHPTLVTYKAQAYHIKCIYKPSEQNVTLGFNVSMLTTAGTIANTGPPPTCILRIVTKEGDEINSAEIGEDLALEVEVQPSSIYGGLARNCIAKTTEDNNENEYLVTDENGCAVDTTIFNDWEYNRDRRTLRAIFHAFKFPNSDNIRFQCNIRICFGQCQPINCHGRNAFGRKRRQIDEDFSQSDKSLIPSGLLKEEIIVQSNPILTFEKQDENLFDRSETTDAQRADDDICVSIWGFIISLILTALLSIVAVAIAVSCWLMAHRRRHVTPGPLPHPPEFPNPLFTSPNPMMEPSPDYLR